MSSAVCSGRGELASINGEWEFSFINSRCASNCSTESKNYYSRWKTGFKNTSLTFSRKTASNFQHYWNWNEHIDLTVLGGGGGGPFTTELHSSSQCDAGGALEGGHVRGRGSAALCWRPFKANPCCRRPFQPAWISLTPLKRLLMNTMMPDFRTVSVTSLQKCLDCFFFALEYPQVRDGEVAWTGFTPVFPPFRLLL